MENKDDLKKIILQGILLFLSIIGDMLSSKLFDCVSALRKSPWYAWRLKKLTEALDRDRKRSEGAYKYTGMDITDFADVCEEVEKQYDPDIIKIETCVKLAMHDLPEGPDRSLFAQLITGYLLADIVAGLCDSCDDACRDFGIKVLYHKYDLRSFSPAMRQVVIAYVRDKDLFQRIVDDHQVWLACSNMFDRLADETFTGILLQKQKQYEEQQENNIPGEKPAGDK